MVAVDPPNVARRRPRRTARQRLILIAGTTLSLGCLAGAGAAFYADSWFAGISRVKIVHAADTVPDAAQAPAPGDTSATTEAGTVPTKAMNVLLTGSDGRNCIAADSPYAGAFLGNGSDIGQRSDTIMVLHLDPTTKQMGLLSFPRDLWVPIAGTKHKSRINSAFDATNPNPLIQTIESTFGVRIDHYVGVDFCAFKGLVDAIGGLPIPFAAPARDRHTGLEVLQAGCHQMAGDEALAYVRSRYYEYQNDKGRWQSDDSSDYGRMARQQDFIRRLAGRAVDKGATNPVTAKHLLDVAHDSNVRIDDGLSFGDLLGLGRAIRDIGPSTAASYRVPGLGQVIAGASVIVPDLTSPESQEILAFFRGTGPVPGTATAATGAPASPAATPPAAPGAAATSNAATATTAGAAGAAGAPSSAAGATATTVGAADPAGTALPTNLAGVYPDPAATCP